MIDLFSLIGLIGGTVIIGLIYREFKAAEEENFAGKVLPCKETKEEFVEDEEVQHCHQTTYYLEDDELEYSMP
jgi:hypothetical protein